MDKKKKKGTYQDLDRKRRTLLRRFREAEKKRSERMNASLKKAVQKEAKTRKLINASPLRRSPSPKRARGEESQKFLAFTSEDNIREQHRILQRFIDLASCNTHPPTHTQVLTLLIRVSFLDST
jgi:hypothetical protein